mmetsp:Transcript_24342/g.63985  ORF Transcript_24342/g.63985 Transcript_24342/m.63985 type:complete len:241 (-) Transcript_24342:187-909(-)
MRKPKRASLSNVRVEAALPVAAPDVHVVAARGQHVEVPLPHVTGQTGHLGLRQVGPRNGQARAGLHPFRRRLVRRRAGARPQHRIWRSVLTHGLQVPRAGRCQCSWRERTASCRLTSSPPCPRRRCLRTDMDGRLRFVQHRARASPISRRERHSQALERDALQPTPQNSRWPVLQCLALQARRPRNNAAVPRLSTVRFVKQWSASFRVHRFTVYSLTRHTSPWGIKFMVQRTAPLSKFRP